MNGDNTSGAIRQLARKMAAETIGDRTDRQLLEHFLAERNESVFEVLVHRHGPMVYRVCWRVLQHAEDAEDAFQATFLVLARSLAAVRNRNSLASWLHGVARRIALKARAQSVTRRRNEALATIPSAIPPDDLTWKELSAALDAELARLPEKWRLPLVLCYLEGRTQDEASAVLGYSGNTLRRRLEDARVALSRRLGRRGFGSVALAAVLVSDCASRGTASPAATSATLEAMTLLATGRATMCDVPPKVAILTEGVMKAMSRNKFKAAVAALLAVGVLGAVGSAFHNLQARVEPPTNALVEPANEAAPAPVPVKPKTDTEKLQGIWDVLETRLHGQTYPTPESQTGRLVIKGDEWRLVFLTKLSVLQKGGVGGGELLFASFKLNTKTSPRNIDLELWNAEMLKDPEAHEVCLGIYKLDGDDLMICLPYLKPCERRPTEFTAEKGSDQQLYKMRRAKLQEK
jgi:RNA polymerase sigma factor (sigma-70 family)